MPTTADTASRLNDQCFCIGVDRDRLLATLERHAAPGAAWSGLWQSHPHLFATAPVFVTRAAVDAMQQVVSAVEAMARLPAYRAAVLAEADPVARHDRGPRGMFMGYDFHLSADGPRLIEINTNAGGAFLNAVLREAQVACCDEVRAFVPEARASDFRAHLATMVACEWRLQGRARPLRSIAIVDTDPETQFLYPEFRLAQAMLQQLGYRALILRPEELTIGEGLLRAGPEPVDFVYNRLTDFMLASPESAALREAFITGCAVVTPSPFHHALMANKRNLALLSSPEDVAALTGDPTIRDALRRIPRTLVVTPGNAGELWSRRKHLFFKPAGGFGSRAVYRGDKLTRGVWQQIVAGAYVAQELVPPSLRTVDLDRQREPRKLDLRLYTYAGETLLIAARLYAGQTTNFRTPAGGFAPVFVTD
jgi:hypothetical protein